MKLASVRIVTRDLVALARFYEQITGIIPAGTEDCVELHSRQLIRLH
jgi:catechol-2,3-dioxygenase